MKCSCFPARDATGREIHTPSCESRMTADMEIERLQATVAEMRATAADALTLLSPGNMEPSRHEIALARVILRKAIGDA